MIACKEDLINTYIVKGDDALTKAYISACKEYVDVYALQCDRWPEDRHLYFSSKCKHIQSGECDTSKYKEITLKDLKSKPTKLVKVEESIFDLKGEFERGELYTKGRGAGGDFFRCITTEGELITFASCGLYRQVEIDWRDELAEFTGLGKDFYTWVDCIDDMYDFNFVEMCHLVASLTENPTN